MPHPQHLTVLSLGVGNVREHAEGFHLCKYLRTRESLPAEVLDEVRHQDSGVG